jgi:hypothetical protein
MLETVRAYATLELVAAGERDDALEGLARYCTREAFLAAEGLVGPAQVEWLNRVHDDLDSYRARSGAKVEVKLRGIVEPDEHGFELQRPRRSPVRETCRLRRLVTAGGCRSRTPAPVVAL